MRNDTRLLEIYIDSMIRLMGEAEYLSKREKDLLHKSNLFNRKNNLEVICREYKKFYDKIDKEWSQIYSDSKEFGETKNFFRSLSSDNTPYATSLTQKLVEQFFYQLSKLTELCIEANNPERKWKRTDSEFYDSFFYYLHTAIVNIFPIVIIAIINHSISIDEDKKKAFIETNKRYIPYCAGDSITDSSLNQMLLNAQKQKDINEEQFFEEIRNGNWKVEPILYRDERDCFGIRCDQCNNARLETVLY
ncbi:MAG: hypothetical protein IKE15_03935 [Clostridia bacterium]|nr:hypothetical protein [Clostridia bacterium]